MKITQQQLRTLIREALKESDRYRGDYERAFGSGPRSFERGQGISIGDTTGFQAASIIGSKKSPTGTKRASLGAAKIQRWISSGNTRRPMVSGVWGQYDDRNGIIPFRGVDWTVGLLFLEGARYVGSQSGINYAAGTEYAVTDPTGLKSSPYSSYVYYVNSRDFIQIDNVSVAQRSEIFNKFRNATEKEKQYYIRVFKGEEKPAGSASTSAPASEPAPSAEPTAPTKTAPASPPLARPAPAADKFASAKSKIKNLVRQPKDYAFWAGMIGKASKGKAGSDATFVKQVLGKDYGAEWTPAELTQLAQELVTMSKQPTK